ncbi:MAG: symmetrical bis(5'-nucleosyl)-tetraphosphatase, partial [Burkholderiales bacterium]
SLSRLIEKTHFDPATDRLWFVGDLVNRGRQSLEVLRFVKELGDSAVCVLGNHDVHLMMVADGFSKTKPKDTIDDVLAAPDRDELLLWLRFRPMLHRAGNDVLVHAGLLPSWTIAQAQVLAREVESALRGEDYRDFLSVLYGNAPTIWSEDLSRYDRMRMIVNTLTRLRICTREGVMDFSHKAGLENLPKGYFSWFDTPNRASASARIICGHWSALGLLLRADLLALDSGCVWGGRLSAVRLEDRRLFQVSCAQARSR